MRIKLRPRHIGNNGLDLNNEHAPQSLKQHIDFRNIRARLFTIFENYYFIMKNKENKENKKYNDNKNT